MRTLSFSVVLSTLLALFGVITLAKAQTQSSQRIQRSFAVSKPGGQNSLPQSIKLLGCAVNESGLTLNEASAARGEFVLEEQVSVSDNTPFILCGITLRLANAAPDNVRVFVRPVNTEKGASEAAWTALPFDDHGDDADRADDVTGNIVLHTHPAFLPAKTRRVEVKVELSRILLRRSPAVQEYQCFLHSPGHTAAAVQSSLQSASLGTAEVSTSTSKGGAVLQGAGFARPAFVTRTEWGCPWGQTSGPNTLTPTVPTHLIVHHSFSPGNDITDWVAAVRGIWNYHVNSNGWSDIGYNWLIDPKGVIYQGRAWVDTNDNTQGAHFCGYNGRTMGVCMLGDFNSITPTDAALRSLVRLLAYRAFTNGINPRGVSFHQGSSRNLNNISGHRDGCSTDCPGNILYPQLPTLRNRVFALLNPPVVERPAVSIVNQQSAEVSAFVRPNGSATDVFVEWDNAASAAPTLRNRRLVRQFTDQDSAQSVSALLSALNPDASYTYRFVAQNSDTSAQTQQNDFSLTRSGVAEQIQMRQGSFSIVPNPVIGAAHISYTLDAPAFVRIRLVDARGGIAASLFEGNQQVGACGVTFCEENLASGMYYCYFEVLSRFITRRHIQPLMILR